MTSVTSKLRISWQIGRDWMEFFTILVWATVILPLGERYRKLCLTKLDAKECKRQMCIRHHYRLDIIDDIRYHYRHYYTSLLKRHRGDSWFVVFLLEWNVCTTRSFVFDFMIFMHVPAKPPFPTTSDLELNVHSMSMCWAAGCQLCISWPVSIGITFVSPLTSLSCFKFHVCLLH